MPLLGTWTSLFVFRALLSSSLLGPAAEPAATPPCWPSDIYFAVGAGAGWFTAAELSSVVSWLARAANAAPVSISVRSVRNVRDRSRSMARSTKTFGTAIRRST